MGSRVHCRNTVEEWSCYVEIFSSSAALEIYHNLAMTSLPSWLGQPRPAASGDVPTSSLVALLDLFFPGFSSLSDAIFKYLGLNLNVYIPVVVLFSGLAFSWSYISGYIWNLVSSHFMSTVEVRLSFYPSHRPPFPFF